QLQLLSEISLSLGSRFSYWIFLSSLLPKEKCGRHCKRSVDQRGKSLLPALIDYAAWREGDTYVFNHRLTAPRGNVPQLRSATCTARARGIVAAILGQSACRSSDMNEPQLQLGSFA